MPAVDAGHEVDEDRTLMRMRSHLGRPGNIHQSSRDNSPDNIFRSIKQQELHFEILTKELEAERRSVTNQIEKGKLKEADSPLVTRKADWVVDTSRGHKEGPRTMSGPHLVGSRMRVLQEKPSEMLQYHPYSPSGYYSGGETQPPPNAAYHHPPMTNTSNGGGHLRDNPSPNSSMHSGDGPQLISRTTARHSTQEVTTVTKVIREREVRHIGPDGQPINYPPYGGMVPPPPADYAPYSYNSLCEAPRNDYGTYESERPPSPGGQEIPPGQEYIPYTLRPQSPGSETGSRRNYDPYTAASPHRGGYPEYDAYGHPAGHPGDYPAYGRQEAPLPPTGVYPPYANYGGGRGPNDGPDRLPTPPSPTSEGSESPPPQRAMPQAPPGLEYNHHPPPYQSSGYEELDATMMPPRPPPPEHPDHFRGTPSPGAGSDRFAEVRWRDPDLPEVIEFLGHPNNVIRANAAAYLQHLCYMDDNIKQKSRVLGGIPPLVALLNHEVPEVHRNACGALRNLSYGRQNDENKRAIKNAGGIPALVRLLRKTPDNEVRELVTGVLWNLSSCEDLKKPIIEDGLTVITNSVVIPHSGWDRNMDTGDNHRPAEIYWSTVFRNASGVLRNASSAGEFSRKKLRECDGLVDALLHLVRAAIGKNDIDNKSVENCVCILRNLSYRCQEVDDPNYDKHVPQAQSRAGAPAKDLAGDNLGCFGASKKKKEGQAADKQRKDTTTSSASPRPRTEPVKGMELLWQPEVVQPYLALLSDCSNPETLEAAAGAIQNLAACYWQPSVDIRAAVRKEKGLPILVELLRMEVDRVVCAVATALRNLALDQRNKELIGKYAMRDLVQKLPSETQQHDTGTSDETIAAVLATLNEVIRKNAEFARSLLEAGGVDRLMYISRQRGRLSSKVVKFASQVLYNLWQHQELREVYKKQGWRENNFITRTMAACSTSPSNINSTLNRPISTQGGTKYEDRTIQRSKELNAGPNRSPDNRAYARESDVPLSDMKYPSQVAPPSTVTRPPAKAPGEPVYAQVNRDRKKNRPHDNHVEGGGGDSWNYEDDNGGSATHHHHHHHHQQQQQQQQQQQHQQMQNHSQAPLTQIITSADGQMGGDSWV